MASPCSWITGWRRTLAKIHDVEGVIPSSTERSGTGPRPDPRLLLVAGESLAESWGLSVDPREIDWLIRSHLNRRESSVFELEARIPDSAPATVFYKIHLEPETSDTDERLRRRSLLTDSLRRSQILTDEFNRIGADHGVRAAAVLALDPSGLSVVTLGVAGRSLDSVLGDSRTRSARLNALETAQRVGLACRLIDTVSDSLAPPEGDDSMCRLVDHYLRRYPLSEQKEQERLSERLSELLELAMGGSCPLAFCHGDLQQDNVLVGNEGIALIDFRWAPRVRGFDLSQTVLRIEYRKAFKGAWHRRLADDVVAGYGDPSIRDTPGWALVEMMFLMRTMQMRRRNPVAARIRRARSLRELRARL
jgi:hypothetical protein